MSETKFKPKFKKGDLVSVWHTPRLPYEGYGKRVKLRGTVLKVNKKTGYCVVRTLINEMGCAEKELTLIKRAAPAAESEE